MSGPRQWVNTSTRVCHVSSFCWLSFGRTMNTSLHRETHCGMHYERHCERVVAIVCYLKLKVVETQRWWCFELKGGPSPKQEAVLFKVRVCLGLKWIMFGFVWVRSEFSSWLMDSNANWATFFVLGFLVVIHSAKEKASFVPSMKGINKEKGFACKLYSNTIPNKDCESKDGKPK
ncbi:hypothetical protein D0Y65_021446 [Glycine soja]|uniref:Uncharacterized protein n=1 Tax=Glycine soja TaxID=3848 RepID=A0A445JJE0_GLYSO|nr:hypothetical protein D0Y65_021446 [Glycine soja]